MVRLQKATQCALFAVLELAADPGRQVSAADIAEKYELSANHLAKVLRELTRARIVAAVRGAGGGYRFAANAKRTTLFDIITLFEDIGEHEDDRTEPGAGTEAGGALDRVIGEIEDIAKSTLKSITLATLLKLMRRRTRST